MTDKIQLIRQEIERRINNLKGYVLKKKSSDQRWVTAIDQLTWIKAFIDSLPEEPSIKGITWEDVNTLESLIYQVHNEYPSIGEKSFGLEVLERFQDCQDDIGEPVSEDLEEAAEKYAYDEFPSIGIPNTVIELSFKAGAEWQLNQMKEILRTEYEKGRFDMQQEMMKDAISCNVDWYDGFRLDYTQEQQDDTLLKLGADVGDKVKIIIVKEEQQ